MLKPIENPDEMDLPAAAAARRVGLTTAELSRALAIFVRSILSSNSPYDRRANPWLDPEITSLRLTSIERTQLASFLQSLNGK